MTVLYSSGAFQFDGREPAGCSNALMVANARAHPHMPRRRKSISPARASGGNAFAEGGAAQSFVLRYNDGWLGRIVLCSSSSRRFFSSDRSLDRPGVYVEVEFLPNQLCEFARPHGLARDELLFDERQCLALQFMGTAWTALLRY